MEIKVFCKGVKVSDAIREHAEERLAKALQRLAGRVRVATVRLEDETGPTRGGVDKVCTLDLKLTRGGEVRIREAGRDFLAVLDAAVSRAKAALGRKVSRRKRGIGEG